MYDLARPVKAAQAANNSALQKDLGCNIFHPCKFITQLSDLIHTFIGTLFA
jgi:hypothetical protein